MEREGGRGPFDGMIRYIGLRKEGQGLRYGMLSGVTEITAFPLPLGMAIGLSRGGVLAPSPSSSMAAAEILARIVDIK